MTTAVIIGLMVTMATVNEFIILPRRLSMRRLHRRGLVSFSRPFLFIPDRDKRDKCVNEFANALKKLFSAPAGAF